MYLYLAIFNQYPVKYTLAASSFFIFPGKIEIMIFFLMYTVHFVLISRGLYRVSGLVIVFLFVLHK